MLLLVIFVVDPAQNVAKYRRWLCEYVMLKHLLNLGMYRVRDLPTSLVICLFAFLMFIKFLSHFPVLNMLLKALKK